MNPKAPYFSNNNNKPVHSAPFGDILEISTEKKEFVDNLKINDQVDFLPRGQRKWNRAVIVSLEWH